MEMIEHPDITSMERWGEVRSDRLKKTIFFNGRILEAYNEEEEEEEKE